MNLSGVAHLCEPWSTLHDVGLPIVMVVSALLVFLVPGSTVPRRNHAHLETQTLVNSTY